MLARVVGGQTRGGTTARQAAARADQRADHRARRPPRPAPAGGSGVTRIPGDQAAGPSWTPGSGGPTAPRGRAGGGAATGRRRPPPRPARTRPGGRGRGTTGAGTGRCRACRAGRGSGAAADSPAITARNRADPVPPDHHGRHAHQVGDQHPAGRAGEQQVGVAEDLGVPHVRRVGLLRRRTGPATRPSARDRAPRPPPTTAAGRPTGVRRPTARTAAGRPSGAGRRRAGARRRHRPPRRGRG